MLTRATLAAVAVALLAGCDRGRRRPEATLRVANVGHGAVVQFCLRPVDGTLFTRLPHPVNGAWAYHPGDSSGRLHTEAGPKVVRVVRDGDECLQGAPLVPDSEVALTAGSATSLVLADGAVLGTGLQRPVLLRYDDGAATDAPGAVAAADRASRPGVAPLQRPDRLRPSRDTPGAPPGSRPLPSARWASDR